MKSFCYILFIFLLSSFANADVPIATDNRIRTVIYSPNEVFKLVVHYGYQTSMELNKDEDIVTISSGDSFSWKITPIENRIFIKPLEENLHTNMTVITTKRTYQFDLFSKMPSGNFDKDLIYVLRFFYPEDLAVN